MLNTVNSLNPESEKLWHKMIITISQYLINVNPVWTAKGSAFLKDEIIPSYYMKLYNTLQMVQLLNGL